MKNKQLLAIFESVAVTAIWASSFVFVKMGLAYMGPLTIAGFRYFLGFLLLLPLLMMKGVFKQPLPKELWIRLLAIGLSAYAIGNGALFWALKYMPATTVSFFMSLSPLLFLFGGMVWLKENPTVLQVAGLLVSLSGSALFFSSGLKSGEFTGVIIVIIGLLGFMAFGILGREVARGKKVDTLTLTTVPLAFGGGFLLPIAFFLEGFPRLTLKPVGIVVWLALFNTALGYLLYNHALKTLTALEMNVILNLAPLGTAFLAWWFLGEQLDVIKIIGMIVMILGVIVVQRA